MEKNQSAIM